MKKITQEHLDHVVDAINTLQGVPLNPWTRVEGKLVPTAWNYHLSGAYGGYALHQHGASGTGTRDIFQVGHVPKSELHALLQAYKAGLMDGRALGLSGRRRGFGSQRDAPDYY
jgi:hypothetical protein|tara:strand:+ start:80 stop:418 length:339 start_codon:yes stop_codon:yes gene_type:complete